MFGTYCASCHGPEGGGTPKGSAITNDSFLALVSDQGLRTIVITGRPELGAPDWRGNVPGQSNDRSGNHRCSCLAGISACAESGAALFRYRTMRNISRNTRRNKMSTNTVTAPPADASLSRRGFFMKLGILFNGFAAIVLALPVARFLFSSITRGRGNGYLSWVRLGDVSNFPEGETRMATFRNPLVMPTDGKTVDTACWVRRIAGDQFQVFAINCAHLGCPVRWFPQSGLFMCPCHGGAYYRDGSRASGPPERGLFEYPYKVENGVLTIEAGQLPTPGDPVASLTSEKPPCA